MTAVKGGPDSVQAAVGTVDLLAFPSCLCSAPRSEGSRGTRSDRPCLDALKFPRQWPRPPLAGPRDDERPARARFPLGRARGSEPRDRRDDQPWRHPAVPRGPGCALRVDLWIGCRLFAAAERPGFPGAGTPCGYTGRLRSCCRPVTDSPGTRGSAAEIAARNRRVVAARANGEPWAVISAREGMSVRQAHRAAAAGLRDDDSRLEDVDVAEVAGRSPEAPDQRTVQALDVRGASRASRVQPRYLGRRTGRESRRCIEPPSARGDRRRDR
jgi:hypothetical protein